MESVKRSALREHHTEIVRDLEPRDVLPQLCQDGVLTGELPPRRVLLKGFQPPPPPPFLTISSKPLYASRGLCTLPEFLLESHFSL